MNRLIVIALSLLALAAGAATVTLHGTAGNSCEFSSQQTDRAGNVIYYCKGVAVVTPAPRPPPVVPPPAAPSCNFPHELRPMGPTGSIQRPEGLRGGVTYSFPLRQVRSSGSFTYAATLGSHSVDVEVSISRCPGDWDAAKRTIVVGGRGAMGKPCYALTGMDGGIAWGPVGTFSVCPVPAGETWYLNWRFSSDPPPMDYYTAET